MKKESLAAQVHHPGKKPVHGRDHRGIRVLKELVGA
jgi:hypothetical protein